MIDFCFAIMSFGERYNKQSERFILDRNNHCKDIPIIVITDNTDYFKNFDNVYPINVGEYNEKYLNYGNKYYNFDSSCKRFLIPSALKLGYKNIVIIDNDNHFLKTWNTLLFRNLFKTNHISAPIVYNYKNHLKLGDMVLYYSNHFNFSIHQNEIRNLPEGCINLLSFDTEERGYNFYNTWNECVMLRDKNKMFKNNNLEEVFFSGKKNGLSFEVVRTHMFFLAKHDTWYR
jgi:hypothetical protein